MKYLKTTNHAGKFTVHQPTKFQTFVSTWRNVVNMELTDIRRQLIIEMSEQLLTLPKVKKAKRKKISSKLQGITKQLQNIEVLTTHYDEILFTGTRKADENSQIIPIKIMSKIWEANQNANFVMDYEKHNENSQTRAIK